MVIRTWVAKAPATAHRVVAGASLFLLLYTRPLLSQDDTRPASGVLVLFASPPDFPFMRIYSDAFRFTVRRQYKQPVDFYEEYLDVHRFDDEKRPAQLVRYLAEKYRGRPIRAVVAVERMSLDFARGPLRELWPDVPIVSGWSELTGMPLPPDVTGVIEEPLALETVRLARRLQPGANRVVIVSGAGNQDHIVAEDARQQLTVLKDSLIVEMLTNKTHAEVLAAVRHLPRGAFVLVVNFMRDAAGAHFVPGDVVEELGKTSNVPVYGPIAIWAERGIVGGVGSNPERLGDSAGVVTAQLLDRRDGAPLPPPIHVDGTAKVDWLQMKRWGLAKTNLPSGTVLVNAPSSLWTMHRTTTLIAITLLVLQSFVILIALYERRRRIGAQAAVLAQLAYERALGDVMEELARRPPDATHTSLQRALAHLGRYADADSALIIERGEAPGAAASLVSWNRSSDPGVQAGLDESMLPLDFEEELRAISRGMTELDPGQSGPTVNDRLLLLPLLAEGRTMGTLAFISARGGRIWPRMLIQRLQPAAELFAIALAREQSSRAIKRSEALKEAVLSSVSSSMAILDRGGVIVRVNKAWREIANNNGIDPSLDAFVGESYLDVCARAAERGLAYASEVREGVASVLAGRADVFRSEYHGSDPRDCWHQLFVERLDHPEGGAVVSHVDVTAWRVAEAELQERRREVEHMSRVAALGELTASLSHELGQPLTSIRLNAQTGKHVLANDVPPLEILRDIIADIEADSVRAGEIIFRVRGLLRNEPHVMKAVFLNDICRDVVRLLRSNVIARRIELQLVLDDKTPAIIGDRIALQQVVLNLLLNALDAVDARDETIEGARLVCVRTCAREPGSVELAVIDTGPGVPSHVLPLIFQPFYSTKIDGLGMGLSVARSIVAAHGGTMRVEKNPSASGAAFVVSFPLRYLWADRPVGASANGDSARSTPAARQPDVVPFEPTESSPAGVASRP